MAGKSRTRQSKSNLSVFPFLPFPISPSFIAPFRWLKCYEIADLGGPPDPRLI